MASDAPLAAVESELVTQGWRRVDRGADLLLIDGRAGADGPNSRGSSAYRLLLVGDGADPTPALRAGAADDVIVLGSPAALRVRLLVAARAIDARRRAASSVAEARRWGLVDEVSGLGSRNALSVGLAEMCVLARSGGIPCALLIVDIDQFKLVNDRYGHVEGDRLIRKTGRTIAEVIRDTDAGFRFGGDEFVLLLRSTSGPDAVAIAERLRFAVSGLSLGTDGSGPEARVTISVGVVALPPGCRASGIEVLTAADAALYEAKRAGRDRVRLGVIPRAVEAMAVGDGRDPDGAADGVRDPSGDCARNDDPCAKGPDGVWDETHP